MRGKRNSATFKHTFRATVLAIMDASHNIVTPAVARSEARKAVAAWKPKKQPLFSMIVEKEDAK